MSRATLFAAASAAALLISAQQGHAQPVREGVPVLMSADEIIHDRELGIVTAKGHVEISQEDRVLVADQVSYNINKDIISASGNVSLLEPTGEVTFAEYFQLSGDLKNGTADNIRRLLADKSRMAAATGRRIDGTRNELDKAVYTACRPCREDPEKAPIWQIKAQRVIHDQEAKTIEYRDAWMEMFGVPVAYTPYLSHPDPSVKRKSGLLTPSIGSSGNLGYSTLTPYFWVLSPQEDVTLSPMITSDEGLVAIGEHRRRFIKGQTTTQGSITRDSRDDVRGHIQAEGLFNLNDNWRTGYEVARTSDDTYLRRYSMPDRSRPWLTTRPYLEGFSGRSYALAEAFSFQGLRAVDDPGQSPEVFPFMQYNHVGDSGDRGGYWTMDASVLALTRGEGRDTRRLAIDTGWQIPYIAPAGDVYTLRTTLRTAAYNVSDPRNGATNTYSTGRVVPEAALDWRYPFVRDEGRISQTIEPVASVIVSPYGGNPDRLPNEDSRDTEFDDTNLFSPNRFTGIDRIETGPRVNYGVNWGAYAAEAGYVNAFFGQSYRLKSDSIFPTGSGLEKNVSDYVGRVDVSPGQYVNLLYRFRLDKDNLAARRQDAGLVLGPRALQLSALYFFGQQEIGLNEFGDREEYYLALNSAITETWSAGVHTRHNNQYGTISSGAQVTYEDECFSVVTSYTKNYTYDRDYQAGQTIMLRLVFKTLGEVPVGTF